MEGNFAECLNSLNAKYQQLRNQKKDIYFFNFSENNNPRFNKSHRYLISLVDKDRREKANGFLELTEEDVKTIKDNSNLVMNLLSNNFSIDMLSELEVSSYEKIEWNESFSTSTLDQLIEKGYAHIKWTD